MGGGGWHAAKGGKYKGSGQDLRGLRDVQEVDEEGWDEEEDTEAGLLKGLANSSGNVKGGDAACQVRR